MKIKKSVLNDLRKIIRSGEGGIIFIDVSRGNGKKVSNQ